MHVEPKWLRQADLIRTSLGLVCQPMLHTAGILQAVGLWAAQASFSLAPWLQAMACVQAGAAKAEGRTSLAVSSKPWPDMDEVTCVTVSIQVDAYVTEKRFS